MYKSIMFVVLVSASATSFACDPYPDCLAGDFEKKITMEANKAREIERARLAAREMVASRNVKVEEKPSQKELVNNAFMSECESLTMNRKLCYELYEERYGNQ